MPNYRLVNPVIIGEFNSSFSASDINDASKMAWESITKHVTNNIPKFAFTLSGDNDKKLHHFVVSETNYDDTKLIDYNLKPLNIKLTSAQESKFLKHVASLHDKMSQTGGKKDKDDSSTSTSSDDSSSEEIYEKIRMYKRAHSVQPISFWWYSPNMYATAVTNFYVPTFRVPIVPYVQIDINSAFFAR